MSDHLRSEIVGVGHYLPAQVVTNHDLEKLMDTSDQWIQERTGIRTRRWIKEGETVTGMAEQAARMALKRAKMACEEIELIVSASTLSDHVFPGSGCFLQAELGLPGIPAIDVRNGCSGFLYALSIADKFIRSGTYRTALVIGAEVQSTSIDLSTRGRDMAVIFADGAGAAVLRATDAPEKGILTTHLHADGRYARKLWLEHPSPNNRPRVSEELLEGDRRYPKMEGRFVFKQAVIKFPEVIEEALTATGYTTGDLDLLIPHQANGRITEAVAQRMGLPMEKVFSNIEHYGNTTAASIPICMSEAWEAGKIHPGALVCLAAFGAGFTWASALVRF